MFKNLLDKIISDNGLRTLIVVKIGALLFFYLYDSGQITFGDKQISAQENSEQSQNQNEPSQGDDYLSQLLELPSVDSEDLKKADIARYYELLTRKHSQVKERIETLRERENRLAKLDRSVEQKIKNLEEERRFFVESIQKEKKVKEERLDNIIDFYKKMKPKAAAPVFEKMDKDLVVALFKRMPVKQTTSILQLMDPEKSVEFTEYFGRIKSGKEYDLLKEVNKSLVKEFRDQCDDQTR